MTHSHLLRLVVFVLALAPLLGWAVASDIDTLDVMAEAPKVRVRVASWPLVSTTATTEPLGVFGDAGERLLVFDRARMRPSIAEAPVSVFAGVAPGTLRLETASGLLLNGKRGGTFALRSLARGIDEIQLKAKTEWSLPGSIELFVQERSDSWRCDVVVRLGIERYLPGVLDGELFSTWPQATFAAQAVAARSYAWAELKFWADRRHYDLVAGPESQMWKGLGGSERAREAVAKTTGVVLVFEGELIQAYYSASCGGRSASAFDAISERPAHHIAPLLARKPTASGCCESEAAATWEARFLLSDLRVALIKSTPKAKSLARLTGCRVTARNSAGRVTAFEFRDVKGKTVGLSAHDLRRILGKLNQVQGGKAAPLRSDDFEPTIISKTRKTPALLEVKGRGFGHGVGLCQYGAKAMGRKGATWQAILKRYYPKSELQRVWTSK